MFIFEGRLRGLYRFLIQLSSKTSSPSGCGRLWNNLGIQLNEAFRSAVCRECPSNNPIRARVATYALGHYSSPNGAVHKVFDKTCIALNCFWRIILRTRIAARQPKIKSLFHHLEFVLRFHSLILFITSLTAGCTDKHKYCSFWAAKGECEKKNPGYMKFFCQKSCEICQGISFIYLISIC